MAARVLVSLAVLGLLLGCVPLRSRRTGTFPIWPLVERPVRPSIALHIYGARRVEGAPTEVPLDTLQRFRDQALRAYRESGLFGAVRSGWGEPGDAVAEILFEVRQSGVRGDDPAEQRQTRGFRMRTRFRDASGASLGELEVSEERRLIGYGVLLDQAGFASGVEREIVYDLHRATLRDALADRVWKR